MSNCLVHCWGRGDLTGMFAALMCAAMSAFLCLIFLVSSLSSSSSWDLVAGRVLANALCSLWISRSRMSCLSLLSFWIAFCLRSLPADSFSNSAIPRLSGFSDGWSVARYRLDSVMVALWNVRCVAEVHRVWTGLEALTLEKQHRVV